MLIGKKFSGDENKILMKEQHRFYGDMLARLHGKLRDRYLDACRLTLAETELAVRVRSMENFDHRTLQDVHDLIAAWFRFSVDDGGQLRLAENEDSYRQRLAVEWRDFFEAEVERLAGHYDFVRKVLTATAFANTEKGYAAEAQLREFLRDRYDFDPRSSLVSMET